jgi:membrane carboxypeptidase/penicillin-binding protein
VRTHRQYVLERMLEAGVISNEQFRQALVETIRVKE